MSSPKPKELSEATGISPSYASMILAGSRTPPRSLAIHIYRATGWRHSSIAEMSDEQIAMFEQVEPWSPRATPSADAQPARAA